VATVVGGGSEAGGASVVGGVVVGGTVVGGGSGWVVGTDVGSVAGSLAGGPPPVSGGPVELGAAEVAGAGASTGDNDPVITCECCTASLIAAWLAGGSWLTIFFKSTSSPRFASSTALSLLAAATS
jgi:hypothetical protein